MSDCFDNTEIELKSGFQKLLAVACHRGRLYAYPISHKRVKLLKLICDYVQRSAAIFGIMRI